MTVVLGTLKCWLFGHTDSHVESGYYKNKERCVRCGTVHHTTQTYTQSAREYIERDGQWRSGYTPVESITDNSGKTMRKGDRIKYYDNSRQAFPGVHLPTAGYTGIVQFIYEDALGENWIKLQHERDLVPERRIIAIDERREE